MPQKNIAQPLSLLAWWKYLPRIRIENVLLSAIACADSSPDQVCPVADHVVADHLNRRRNFGNGCACNTNPITY